MNEPLNIKAFISYSHDSDQHMNRVLWLSDKLRAEGVDCEIDQYETSPPGGWPRWARDKIKEADFVLVVCTQAYAHRYEATGKKGVGAGAKWEGAIITQHLYDAEGTAHKFIPVIFSAEDVENIPLELRGSPFYVLDGEGGYEALYRHLTGQPKVIKQRLGQRRSLPPRERKENPFNPKDEPEPQKQSGPPPGKSRVRGVFTQHWRRLVIALVASGVVLGVAYYLWPRKRIAVMPFAVVSSDLDIEHLSGLTTDFLERSLSRVSRLSVQAHTSVFYYKDKRVSPSQIGQDLDVSALLTGRISQRGNWLRVDVDVVDALTEESLWRKTYEDELTDLPSLQSTIAYDVATYFSPWWSSDAGRRRVAKNDTLSYEALELYSQGRRFWRNRNKEGNLLLAIENFEEAVKKDPGYAQAYIGLADCYALLEDFEGYRASFTLLQAEENIERALRIDDSLAEAHASKGFILFNKWDWGGAERAYKRAIEMNPDYPTTYQRYSILLRTIGGARFDEALAQIKKAEELDKLSDVIISNVGVFYLSKGDADNAAYQFEKMLKLYPDSAAAQRWLAMAYIKQGRKDAALAALQKGIREPVSGGALEFQGYIYAVAGMKEEAAGIAERLEKLYHERKAGALNVAAVYAGLGDKDKAIQWLRTAKDDRSGTLPFMRMPMFESLRGDPRYDELLRQINLAP